MFFYGAKLPTKHRKQRIHPRETDLTPLDSMINSEIISYGDMNHSVKGYLRWANFVRLLILVHQNSGHSLNVADGQINESIAIATANVDGQQS